MNFNYIREFIVKIHEYNQKAYFNPMNITKNIIKINQFEN